MQQVGIEFITRGDKEAEAAIRRLGQSVTGLTQKQIQNGEAGKRLENQRQREVAQTARLEQEYRRLMGAVNPLIGRQNQMREAHAKITQALNREIITRDQAAQSLREYRAALQAGTLAGQGAGKGMNRLGVLAQQSGYQFGDFAVQVQSGTNWMVAFGQQATQLIGTFSMLSKSTKAIAAFSALGVAVPVITAIAGAWMRTREEAEGAEDAFDSLENSLSEISGYSNTARMSLAELREEFGSNAVAIRDNTKALRELATVRALDDLQNTVNGLSESVTKTIDRFAQLESRVRRGTREQIAALAEEVGYTAEQATQLREAFAALGEAEGLPGSIKAAEDLHDVMINVFGSSRDIPPELALAAEQALRAANAGRELEAGMSGAADETGRGASNANSLAGQLAGAAAQARVLVANLGFVPTALAGLAEDVTSQIESMRVANVALTDQIENGTSSRIASLKAERDAILNTMEIEGQNLSLQTESIDRINDQITALEEEEVVYDRLTDTLAEKVKAETASTGSTKASGKAAKEAAKELEKLADEISRLEDAADPTRKFVREMEKLDKLRALENGLSDGAYAEGVRALNEELVETHPILSDVNDAFGQMVDYMFDGFQDGLKGIWRIFTQTLKNMAAAALKSRITIGIGTAATGGAGAAAAGTPGGSFFGGGGNILGALGGFAGDIGLGLSTATGAGSAGLFAVSQNAAVAVAAGAGQFAATIGAALPVIGAVVGAAALLKSAIGTTTKLTNAIEGRFELAGLTGGGEYDMKESDGWFSKGIEKNFESWEGSWAEDIGRHADEQFQMIAGQMRQSISELGLEVQDFIHDFDFQFQEGSLEPGALYTVVEEEAKKAGDAMLKAALAAAGLARDGETGAETLQILLAAINGVNGAAMLLGGTMLEANAITAGAARQFIELAGGLDAFNAKVEGLFTNFLTEAEQITRAEELAQTALDNFSTSLEAMGMVLPETHAEYLALYNAQDLTTEGGRQLAAALLDLQDEFVTVNGTAQEAAAGLDGMSQTMRSLLLEEARLLGDTQYIREQEMEGLSELEQVVQQRIYNLQDEATAAAALEVIERSRITLLNEIARVTGNVTYLQQQGLAALDASVRPLQEFLNTLENTVTAARAARDANNDLLATLREQASETENLISQVEAALGIGGESNPATELVAAQEAYDAALVAVTDRIETETARLQTLGGALQGAAESLGVAFDDLGRMDAPSLADQLQTATQTYETALSELASHIESERNRLESEIAALGGALQGAADVLGAVFDDLGRLDAPSLADQLQTATQTYSSALDALRAGIDRDRADAESRLSDLESQRRSIFGTIDSIVDKLRSAAREIFRDNERIVELQRKQAMEQLRQILATGDVNPDTIDGTISRATSFGDVYATRTDMMRDQAQTANLLDRIADEQKAIADVERAEEEIDRRTIREQLRELKDQTAQAEREIGVLDALERDFGLAVQELTVGELADNVSNAKTALTNLFSEASAEYGLLDDQLTDLNEIARVMGFLETALTTDQLAQNVSNAKTALTNLFSEASAEYGLLDDQLTELEDAVTAAEGIEIALTTGDLAQNLSDAKTALDTANTNALTYHNALVQAINGINIQITNINGQNQDLDDVIAGGGGGATTPALSGAENILLGALDSFAPELRSLLGAATFGNFSADNTNALLSDAGVAALTDQTARAIAAEYEAVLGRNPDVLGLQYFMGEIARGFDLSGFANLQTTLNEIASGVAPGFGTLGSATRGLSGGGGGAGAGGSSGGGGGGGGSGGSSGGVDAAMQAAIANGTASFPKPNDFIGQAFGDFGIPISAAGYNFWKGVWDNGNNPSFRTEEELLTNATAVGDPYNGLLPSAREDGTFGTVPRYLTGTEYHPGGPAITHANEMITFPDMPRGTSVTTAGEVAAMVKELKAMRSEAQATKEYIRELVKINLKQERSLKEIEFQGETTP